MKGEKTNVRPSALVVCEGILAGRRVEEVGYGFWTAARAGGRTFVDPMDRDR